MDDVTPLNAAAENNCGDHSEGVKMGEQIEIDTVQIIKRIVFMYTGEVKCELKGFNYISSC